mgnify:CR=1 FL=1
MSDVTIINLEDLPPPDVLEHKSFQEIYQELLQVFAALAPEYRLFLHSDPAIKVLQAFAYREYLVRGRINTVAEAVMVARATGADLDNLVAFFGVRRLDGETDKRLRARYSLASEALSVAGPVNAYKYHAFTASVSIKDVGISSPKPGYVLVTLLGEDGTGEVSTEVINKVREALNADDVRPLTDTVSVRSARIVSYNVSARLVLLPGPAADTVLENAQRNVERYTASRHRINSEVTLSGLMSALHVEGVQQVELDAPSDLPLQPSDGEALFANSIEVDYSGRDS